MTHSESVSNIFAALARAQGEFPPAKKDATNPHAGCKYADLASVMEACRAPLAKNDLAVIQTSESVCLAEPDGDDPTRGLLGVKVITTIVHSSGEWIRGELFMPLDTKDTRKSPPQQYASSYTYGRRHALMAILGIAAEEDDGESQPQSQGRQRSQSTQQQTPPLTLQQVRDAIGDLFTLEGITRWQNEYAKAIVASPEKKAIYDYINARIAEAKKAENGRR